MTLLTITALLFIAPAAVAELPWRLKEIRAERAQTWRCQDALGVPRSRVAHRKPSAGPYRAWVLHLWQARRKGFCAASRTLRRLQAAIPDTEAELRRHVDSCLAEIIERETAGTWDPTVWNYSGSGAYGLPQALPGSKMASAGPDWRTNPLTQIRWMRAYVNERYGGSCNALAHHNAVGSY